MVRTSLAFTLALGLVVGFCGLGGCSKDGKARQEISEPTPVTAGAVGSDGVRRIAIEANTKGYVPDRIGGKPGEKLTLVFTRTVDSTCIAQLKTPDGKLIDLPKGTPVEVAVTVPPSGEVGFACGMDMFHGAVIANKG
ncbi:MAG TPA: cupredoxin domain-containing protein [Kofleriaceae bacterium]|jgi:plastocyanin domain-containing protein|nr:cupredoxin domain-containing protein [Kofleriaceae bacterium]